MPGEAALYVDLITNNSGKRRLERIYSSYSNGSVYLVVSFDKEGSSIKDTLDNFKAHHLHQAEVTPERDVTLDNFKGKQYRLTLGGAVGTLQCYVTKQHAYAVAVVQASDDPPLREYFLSSLSLKKSDDGSKGSPRGNNEPQAAPPSRTSDFSGGGQNGNTDNGTAVLTTKDVVRKAIIVSRPEPVYTDEARQSNVSGTVVLRAVFSSSGEVTNIKVVKGLPHGLSENAVEAARHLRFIPAIKEGRFVSQYIQIEYNFGLY